MRISTAYWITRLGIGDEKDWKAIFYLCPMKSCGKELTGSVGRVNVPKHIQCYSLNSSAFQALGGTQCPAKTTTGPEGIFCELPVLPVWGQ
jgi:hypothetical protein